MRKRFHDRVCRCTPKGCMVYINARLLHDLVNAEIHALRCAEKSSRKGALALRLGDLCADARHPWWAIKVWQLGCRLVESQDYDDWIGVWFNTDWVRLSHVVSEGLCLMLGRRIDDQWRALSHPEMADYEAAVQCSYDWLWYEKYDYWRSDIDAEWDSILSAYESQQQTEAIFNDGLG